jgi:predicted nucleic acid binding AN1-type Zn finger protein
VSRCYAGQCRKLIRDLIWECRCGGKYCLDHRLPEVHRCTFDFKKDGKESLQKGLIRVVGEKIERI